MEKSKRTTKPKTETQPKSPKTILPKAVASAEKALEAAQKHYETQVSAVKNAEKENTDKTALYPLQAAAKIAKAQLKIKKVEYKLAKFIAKVAQKRADKAKDNAVKSAAAKKG
jgi:hypothetical protein